MRPTLAFATRTCAHASMRRVSTQPFSDLADTTASTRRCARRRLVSTGAVLRSWSIGVSQILSVPSQRPECRTVIPAGTAELFIATSSTRRHRRRSSQLGFSTTSGAPTSLSQSIRAGAVTVAATGTEPSGTSTWPVVLTGSRNGCAAVTTVGFSGLRSTSARPIPWAGRSSTKNLKRW